MKIFFEWFLVVNLLSYLWLYRYDSNALLSGAAYFVAAGLLGTVAREMHAHPKQERKESAVFRSVAARTEIESLILVAAYLLCLLSFLNSAVTVTGTVVSTAVVPLASCLIYSGASFWMVRTTHVVAPERYDSKNLPPLFIFVNLYIFVALLVPLTVVASSRRAIVSVEFARPPALALLFVALCSASLGVALFRRSLVSSLGSRLRKWIAIIMGVALLGAALLQLVTRLNWYSYCLSSVTVLGVTVGVLRLQGDFGRPVQRIPHTQVGGLQS